MEDIDALCGRPLDAALAHQLFGYEIEQRTNSRTRQLEPLRHLDNGE